MLLHVSLETERNLEILGQEGPLDDERPEGPVADTIGAPMDASELTARFLDLVDAHYVVSEKAGGIRDRIEAELAAGTYASLSPSAFAEAITADLRECSDLPLEGLRQFRVRIYPFHALLAHRFECGYMAWL